MFENYYQNIKKFMIPAQDYRPLSSIEDRKAWGNLLHDLSEILLMEGEKFLGYDWPLVLATDFMDYSRTGSREQLNGKTGPRRHALMYLVLAECVENKGRFMDDIVNGIWTTCDEATWIISAHNHMYPAYGKDAPVLPDTSETVKIFIDIMAGDVGALMAVIYYLIRNRLDEVTPSINRRLLKTLQERILTPYRINDDYPWMGVGRGYRYINNWTVWIISNVLAVTALTVSDEETRAKIIEKSLYYVDQFILGCPEDGSYMEGSGYWTIACGSLLNALDLIKGMTGGKLDFFEREKIQNLTSFIYRVHIDGNMFVNNGDANLCLPVSAQRLYSMGVMAGNNILKQFAIAMREVNGPELMPNRLMHPFLAVKELNEYAAFAKEPLEKFPYLEKSWQSAMEILCEREMAGTKNGLYLSVKGGTNVGSHNHMDVGSFLIFSDGQPAVIDIGTGEYSAATFGVDRNKIKQISSQWHNVPYICGSAQYLDIRKMSMAEAKTYCAKNVKYGAEGELTELSMDIRDVYPKECPLEYWKRIFRFDHHKKEIEIREDFRLAKQEGDTYISLVTAGKPTAGNGLIQIPVKGGKDIVARYSDGLTPEVDEYYVGNDKQLAGTWGERVWRIRLFLDKNLTEGRLTVIFHQQ